MSEAAKKITVSLPASVLNRAQKITGKSAAETIVEALTDLERRNQPQALQSLRNRVKLDLGLKANRL